WVRGVHQTPPALIRSLGDKVQLVCTHGQTDYRVMLWYQQPPGQTEIKLIGYLNYYEVKMEKPYEQHFSIHGDLSKNDAKNVSLIFSLTGDEDSAVYYCAASLRGLCSFTEAYFGAGTKLTVLVKVLKPSVSECRNRKDNKQYNKTLVCVASDFYPDHVSVFWQIDGGNVTRGVATDSSARRDGKYYRITSRLMVPLTQWYTPEKNFSCTVSFFNGNKTTYSSNWVRGIEERYLRITHNAKLSYAVLIVKSSFFGVFVVVLLLCKLKVGPPSYCVQAT
uniref:Ig-like domain-containing protein n=1 Tax=Seriola dumerili TaxID=41447 RepID=A0A3B4TQW4_SERDU